MLKEFKFRGLSNLMYKFKSTKGLNKIFYITVNIVKLQNHQLKILSTHREITYFLYFKIENVFGAPIKIINLLR